MEIHLFDDCDIFAITVSRSITKKGSTWIGILVFFVLQYVLGWQPNAFGEDAAWAGPMASISFSRSRRYGIDRTPYTLAWGRLLLK